MSTKKKKKKERAIQSREEGPRRVEGERERGPRERQRLSRARIDASLKLPRGTPPSLFMPNSHPRTTRAHRMRRVDGIGTGKECGTRLAFGSGQSGRTREKTLRTISLPPPALDACRKKRKSILKKRTS